MEAETLVRFNREMKSFYVLLIINIVGAGIAMSYGVAVGVNNLIPMINDQRILLLQAALSGLALVGFGIAIRWLILSAQILDGFDDLRDMFKNRSDEADEEAMTELIIQNMAFYRDNRPIINKLMLGSRVTGTFFLLSGAAQVLFMSTKSFAEPVGLFMATFGTLICIAIGVMGVYLPSFFNRYTGAWDQRLMDAVEAEKSLGDILE